jgi:hypothetical protein
MRVSTDAADIAENRQGRLSQAQIAAYDQELRGARRWKWLVPFLFVTFIAASAILPNTTLTAGLIAFGIVEVAAGILFFALGGWIGRRARANVLAARVECKIGRLTHFRRGAYGPYCYVSFGDEEVLRSPLEIIASNRKQFEERPQRVYFLERLGDVVAIEPE